MARSVPSGVPFCKSLDPSGAQFYKSFERFEKLKFIFISNQIGSNAIKEVFEAGDGRSPIVVKQRGCLVDIPDSVRTNSNTGAQDF